LTATGLTAAGARPLEPDRAAICARAALGATGCVKRQRNLDVASRCI